MAIYKRKSGRYAVLIDIDRGADGKRQRRPLGTFRTRKEAERAERDALAARDRGIDLSPRSVTVAELLKRYLADRKSRCGAKTLQEYGHKADLYIIPHLGSMLLAKLRPAHVAEWQSSIGQSGGRGGKPVSAKTVTHARSLLYGALQWAVTMQLVAMNACSVVEAPKVRRSDAKALPASEVAKLLATASGTRWGPFVTLALAIGARRGELLAIRWESVDLARRTVTIGASISQTRAGGLAVKGTKSDVVRTIPLSRVALEALQKQRALQAADKLRAGQHYVDAGFVFADELGGCLSPMAATNAYARLARKAGISSTRLHDTRHTVATTLLTSGVDVRTTAGVLGHSSPVVTMTTYAHLLSDVQRDAVDRLGAALDTIIDRKEAK